MRGVTRPLIVLVVLQGSCLAAGLWIHDRFLMSAARFHGHTPAMAQVATAPGEEILRLFDAMPGASLIAFAWTLGLQSVVAYLFLARFQREHARKQLHSNEQTLRQTRDLVQTRDAVIFGLAKLAESRDPETGHHLERISLYSTRLTGALSRDPKYRNVITPAFMRHIGISAALHDIGKVGIEDSVLLKPGELTPKERFEMQLHAEVGAECIREIERRLGTSNFLEMAREIAYSHHERWDGSGYPQGLSGEQIPLAARIVAIADVYDALSVRRVYKDPFPHHECVEIIRQEAGSQFDPDLVRVFLEVESQFQEIACHFANETRETLPREADGEVRFTPDQKALLAALEEYDQNARTLAVVGCRN